MKIQLDCCEGKDERICLKDRCPHYRKARARVQQNWPYVGTGFGNLYGNPKIGHFLAAVREDLAKKSADKPPC